MMHTWRETIVRQLEASAEVKRRLAAGGLAETIEKIAKVLWRACQQDRKIILFGNGGSAADAQHIAGELAGRLELDRPAVAAIALTTNAPLMTAIANDHGYERVFARQVEALVQPGDVVLAISTSGTSPNVLAGVRTARERGATTIGFTGQNGKPLASMVDICLAVPSTDTQRIQEAHITVGHVLCHLIERALYEEAQRAR